jgi:hypothetical protein
MEEHRFKQEGGPNTVVVEIDAGSAPFTPCETRGGIRNSSQHPTGHGMARGLSSRGTGSALRLPRSVVSGDPRDSLNAQGRKRDHLFRRHVARQRLSDESVDLAGLQRILHNLR